MRSLSQHITDPFMSIQALSASLPAHAILIYQGNLSGAVIPARPRGVGHIQMSFTSFQFACECEGEKGAGPADGLQLNIATITTLEWHEMAVSSRFWPEVYMIQTSDSESCRKLSTKAWVDETAGNAGTSRPRDCNQGGLSVVVLASLACFWLSGVWGHCAPAGPGGCTGCTGCTTGAQGHLDRGARSSTQQHTGSTTAQTADPGPPDHTTSPCKTQSPRLMAESLWAQNPGQKLGRAKSKVAL